MVVTFFCTPFQAVWSRVAERQALPAGFLSLRARVRVLEGTRLTVQASHEADRGVCSLSVTLAWDRIQSSAPCPALPHLASSLSVPFPLLLPGSLAGAFPSSKPWLYCLLGDSGPVISVPMAAVAVNLLAFWWFCPLPLGRSAP